MREKRKFTRVKKGFAINIVSVDTDGKHLEFYKIKASPKFYDESGIDFSPRGLEIICSKSLPPNARIQMKLLIPDADTLNVIKASGIIKWFKEIKGKYEDYFQLGIAFKNLGITEKKKLTRLWKKYS